MRLSTWMVVEDEPDIYDVLMTMFQIWGIEGVAFTDGPDAFSWVEDVDRGAYAGELPELAILDVRLPELSGPVIGERLRRSPKLRNIGIVLITAYRLPKDEEAQLIAEARADDLMHKPLPQMMEFRRRLDEVVAKRKSNTGPLNGKHPNIVSPSQPDKSDHTK
jgi:CheY-like chemotaxis protein